MTRIASRVGQREGAKATLCVSRSRSGALFPSHSGIKRDYELTSVALVGAINGLINTWTAGDDWEERFDHVAGEAARMIVVATRNEA